MVKKDALNNAEKFAVVTVSLGVAGGCLLKFISSLRLNRETVYTYEEDGLHVRRISQRPLIWLFAMLDQLHFPFNRRSKKNRKGDAA